ncbi:MAG: hypothetical protein IT260_24610 [Saprospiraceae bacterium]|nr:hypothetical protein [Saprospiraceae bacterium]
MTHPQFKIPAICTALFTLAVFFCLQCTKSEGGSNLDKIRVLVDGAPFKRPEMNAYIKERTLYFKIFGDNNAEILIVKIAGFTGVGNYRLEKPYLIRQENSMVYNIGLDNSKIYSNESNQTGIGSLEVTKMDSVNHQISAKFDCLLNNTTLFNESVNILGHFDDQHYTFEQVDDNISVSYLLASIDGNEFVGSIDNVLELGDHEVIKAINGRDDILQIKIPNSIDLYDEDSTYTIGGPHDIQFSFENTDGVDKAVSGQLTILRASWGTNSYADIRGAFNFVTLNGRVVSGGEFAYYK